MPGYTSNKKKDYNYRKQSLHKRNVFTNVSNYGPHNITPDNTNINQFTKNSYLILVSNLIKCKFVKSIFMALVVEDLENQKNFRLILSISYNDLIEFIFDNIKRRSAMTIFFWSACLIFLGLALKVRISIAGYFTISDIILHSSLGLIVFPILCIPVHELLHIIPYYLSGARRIRVGMDLKQYLFYVTAHRYVASPMQFRVVAFLPFILINTTLLLLVFILPGLWKWSLSIFLFVHTTMCAGDFALLNFYFLNKDKKIYTWDDADKREAYFYEETGK